MLWSKNWKPIRVPAGMIWRNGGLRRLPLNDDRLTLPAQLAKPLVTGTFRLVWVNLDELDIIYTASHCEISRVAFLSLIGRDTPEIHGVRGLSSLDTNTEDLLVLTTDVVAAYVQKNVVPAADLAKLIQTVHSSLASLSRKPKEAKTAAPEAAVPVKKSIRPDAIICLECGKGFKSLRRHLNANHDQTPDEYRARWSLPADYPIVAPEYSEARSSLAKATGLGQRRAKSMKGPKA